MCGGDGNIWARYAAFMQEPAAAYQSVAVGK
jgi:hypothetical protein